MVDWTSVILAILSGTTVSGVFNAVAFRRQNSRIRNSEVNRSETSDQVARIDLANEYLKKVMALSESNYSATLKNNDDIHIKVAEVVQKINGINEEMRNITTYLNGNYQLFLKKCRNGDKKRYR